MCCHCFDLRSGCAVIVCVCVHVCVCVGIVLIVFAFITGNSSLEPLLEGRLSQIYPLGLFILYSVKCVSTCHFAAGFTSLRTSI